MLSAILKHVPEMTPLLPTPRHREVKSLAPGHTGGSQAGTDQTVRLRSPYPTMTPPTWLPPEKPGLSGSGCGDVAEAGGNGFSLEMALSG